MSKNYRAQCPHAPYFHAQANLPGVSSAFELAIRFHIWASERKGSMSIEDIRTSFGVSRATAYRWRSAWSAANGLAA